MYNGVFVLNIVINTVGLSLCIFSLLQVITVAETTKAVERYFLHFFGLLATFALSNTVGLILRGHPGNAVRVILLVTNFCEFLVPCILVYIMSIFLLSRVDVGHERTLIRKSLRILLLVHVLLLGISQFTGLYYYIDENNVYHRSDLYPLSYVFALLILALDAYIILMERDKLSRRESEAFWIYMTVPVAAAGMQLFVYGIYIVVFATILSGFIMYLFILSDIRNRNRRQIDEISRLKTDLLISQVRPHFIFNSLTAIRSLCDMDSEAYDAIEHFAGFLRGSMDVMNEKSCIPMTREINTVENYLYMEKLRFEDKLEIVSDFQDTDFVLPACSVQVLVENAVKHGIRMNYEGRGTLIMRSFEAEDEHVVEILDNGVGFDSDELDSSGSGIKNVQRRLEIMCGGRLELESTIGKGTVARILIPKEKGISDK